MTGMKKILTAGTTLAAAGALMAGVLITPASSAMEPPFGTKADQAFAADLWKAMAAASLVGSKSINTRPYEGQEPHGAILETLDSTITVKGVTGAVVVKKNYGPAGISVEAVSNNPAKHLKAVTVMFKRKGYDADNKDWFWVKYGTNGVPQKNPKGMSLAGRVAKGMSLAGRVAKGTEKGCIACHKGAGDDYLFTTDRIK